jgi:methionine salvage enolase-phosphatase E1
VVPGPHRVASPRVQAVVGDDDCRVADSYRKITAAIGTDPHRTAFLSDVTAELDAARQAGWQTVGARRPGEPHYAEGVGELDLNG